MNAVLATTAAALLVLQPEWDLARCEKHSRSLWTDRDPARLD